MARNCREYYTVALSCDDWVRTQKPVEKLKVHKCIFPEGRPDVPMRYSIFLLWPVKDKRWNLEMWTCTKAVQPQKKASQETEAKDWDKMTTEAIKMRHITLGHCLVSYCAYTFQGLGVEIHDKWCTGYQARDCISFLRGKCWCIGWTVLKHRMSASLLFSSHNATLSTNNTLMPAKSVLCKEMNTESIHHSHK